jgi:hypothetical protein
MTAPPPLEPEELVSTGTEREVLEAFLDCQRREVRAKLLGVSEGDARRRLVPSLTTLAGLVKHLAAVERNWFQHRLAQRPRTEIRGDSMTDNASWAVGPTETVDGLLADYDDACEESRRVAAGFTLDDAVPHPRLGRVSLRWIYGHMIEETARHAGHADILREQVEASD